MKVGIPKETFPGETRVALIPETVKRLAEKGVEVVVEKDAGASASHPDASYQEAGASIEPSHDASSAEIRASPDFSALPNKLDTR